MRRETRAHPPPACRSYHRLERSPRRRRRRPAHVLRVLPVQDVQRPGVEPATLPPAGQGMSRASERSKLWLPQYWPMWIGLGLFRLASRLLTPEEERRIARVLGGL